MYGMKELQKIKALRYVWHEGITGRKLEEIASMFIAALQADRDYKKVFYFLQHCKQTEITRRYSILWTTVRPKIKIGACYQLW